MPDPVLADVAPQPAIAACGPVMRSGAAAAVPLVRPHQPAELSELVPFSFALVSIEKTGNLDGTPFPLACCLVQLPRFLPPDFNSRDPTAQVAVRWWTPSSGGYAGPWSPWIESGSSSQSESQVMRGALAVVNVQLWKGSNNPHKPLRDRRARMTAASIGMIPELNRRTS